MAIWQIWFCAIPIASIKRQLGEVSDEVDANELEGPLWDGFELHKDGLFPLLDRIVPRAPWSNSETFVQWKGDTSKAQDNDVSVTLAEGSGLVRGLSFRGDIRDQTTGFLGNMADLCDWLDLMLRRPGGEVIFRATREAVCVPPEVSEKWMKDCPPIDF